MKLSTSTRYALNALLQLAECPASGLVSCATLAQKGGMPPRNLLQILRALASRGILDFARGSEGGFAPARKPEEISLWDIIEAIDGPFSLNQPLLQTFPVRAAERLQHAFSSIRDLTRQRHRGFTGPTLLVSMDWKPSFNAGDAGRSV